VHPPLALVIIEPGHDGWVVGDEPNVLFELGRATKEQMSTATAIFWPGLCRAMLRLSARTGCWGVHRNFQTQWHAAARQPRADGCPQVCPSSRSADNGHALIGWSASWMARNMPHGLTAT
jgi:hypothetical protein